MLHRLLWLFAGLTTVVLAAAWFIHSTDPINPATFERIEVGMTLAEVDTTIGEAPLAFLRACKK